MCGARRHITLARQSKIYGVGIVSGGSEEQGTETCDFSFVLLGHET